MRIPEVDQIARGLRVVKATAKSFFRKALPKKGKCSVSFQPSKGVPADSYKVEPKAV